jgi:hypothetical protein
MKSIRLLVCAILCLVFAAGAAHAQGVGASGNINGVVTDPSGAVVPNATVTAVETGRGAKFTAVTDSAGQFRLTGLPPATYDVSTQATGFGTEVQKGAVVNVGETSILDFHLKVATTGQTIEVNAEPPVVDIEQTSQANTISQNYIMDLPINRRDYLTFTLLAPGVANSTRLTDDQDYRVKQTPQSGLSFYGSNGRGNTVTVDGGEANDDSGGVRLTVSQDAVQEFQINRSNYTAELGGASGAAINIVTNSGTNNVHGTLFGFFRSDSLDAQDPFSATQALAPGTPYDPLAPASFATPVKNTLSRQQFGGSVGFPIQKDKTFLFIAFEGLRQDSQTAVPILTNTNIFLPTGDQNTLLGQLTAEGLAPVPCFAGMPNIPAKFCAQALGSALTVSQSTGLSAGQMALNQYIVGQFESNGGLFNYNTRTYLGSVRLDHQMGANDHLSVLFTSGSDSEQNPDVQSLTGFTRGSQVNTVDYTMQAKWFHIFSPTAQNEARVQWNYNDFNVIPNVPGQAGLDIPGFANIGTQIFLPSFTIMRRWDVADNVTLNRGRHTLKFGGEFLYRGNHTESHTFFPGRFVFGGLPGPLLSPCLVASTAGPNPCGLTTPGANIDSLQTVSLGLPQFYQQGFGNPTYNYPRPFGALFFQDSWQVRPNFTFNYGLRYEIDGQYGPLATDKDNFAPRISFAWDPFKDHKTVVRGGFGIFYSPIYGQIADVVQTLGVVNGFQQISQVFAPLSSNIPCLPPGGPSTPISACIFQTLFAEGRIQCQTPAPGAAACITPDNLKQFGIHVTTPQPTPLPPLSVVFSGQPGYQSPYSEQAELGVERELGAGFVFSASYVYVHTLRLPVAIDINALPAPFVHVPLANGSVATYRDWNINPALDVVSLLGLPGGAPCAGAAIVTCFANPFTLQADQYSSKASALFQGGIFQLKRRFSNHFTFFANYTYSKAFDTTTDFNSDFGPVDNTNLGLDRGLSTFDQRNKVLIAGVFDSPWKNPAIAGFQLSPIFTYYSGHPFTLLADSTDVNGDRHYTNDRPVGAGRNTGLGPSFTNFDLRLSRTFKFGERYNVQLLAEAFNLANHTNFASVNNEVSPLFGVNTGQGVCPIAGQCLTGNTSFNVHGIRPSVGPNGAVDNVSQPLVFTSDFPKREIQLGIRFSF